MAERRTLSRAADWSRVAREGRPGRCGGLRVRIAPRAAPELPSRLGLRVRVEGRGRAVRRNRARRRLRAAWRAVAPERGFDAVLYADAAYADKNFQTVTDDLRFALARAGGAGEA